MACALLAAGVVLDILLRLVREHGICLFDMAEDSLFEYLHKRVDLLFKKINQLPMMWQKEIEDGYQTLFNRPFPRLNRFYESGFFA